MAPRFSVIVVNWNGGELLEPCLESVLAQSCRDHELIVVDNASTDGTRELLERDWSTRARLVLLPQNQGFSGGNNRGFAAAEGELIALLNNDAIAAPGWLDAVDRAAARHPDAGMFACRIHIKAEPHRFDSAGLKLYPDGMCRSRGWLEVDVGQYETEEEVIAPNGAAAVLRRQMLEEVGFFDEQFFAYLEDLDLALRGQTLGYSCLYVPDAVVHHVKSSSLGHHSIFKAFHVERNRIWVLVKLFPWRLILVSPAFTTYRYLLQGYAALTNRGASGGFVRNYSRRQLLLVLMRALVGAFAELPSMLRKRQWLRRRRRISSRDFMRLVSRFKLPAIEIALKD